MRPEVDKSAALSLLALPGDGGVATRKVAILVSDGIETATLTALHDALNSAGAVVRLLGTRLGSYTGADGIGVEVDATVENSPAVLFDGLILPAGVTSLARSGQAIEFIQSQYRHCKTILVLGDAATLLAKAGIEAAGSDPGLLVERPDLGSAAVFIAGACPAPPPRA